MRSVRRMGQEEKVAIDEVLSMLKLDASETCICYRIMFSFFYNKTIESLSLEQLCLGHQGRDSKAGGGAG